MLATSPLRAARSIGKLLGSCIPTALFVLLMVPRTGTALQLGLSFEILATNDRLSMVLRLIHDSSRSREVRAEDNAFGRGDPRQCGENRRPGRKRRTP
jgi:hypothetical protein